MPAAAVIPAPIAYIKVVAVKKLVVGLQARLTCLAQACTGAAAVFLLCVASVLHWARGR